MDILSQLADCVTDKTPRLTFGPLTDIDPLHWDAPLMEILSLEHWSVILAEVPTAIFPPILLAAEISRLPSIRDDPRVDVSELHAIREPNSVRPITFAGPETINFPVDEIIPVNVFSRTDKSWTFIDPSETETPRPKTPSILDDTRDKQLTPPRTDTSPDKTLLPVIDAPNPVINPLEIERLLPMSHSPRTETNPPNPESPKAERTDPMLTTSEMERQFPKTNGPAIHPASSTWISLPTSISAVVDMDAWTRSTSCNFTIPPMSTSDPKATADRMDTFPPTFAHPRTEQFPVDSNALVVETTPLIIAFPWMEQSD